MTSPTLVLTDATEVTAALEHSGLAPPRSPDSSRGSTMELRDAMARFSGVDAHQARRAAVVEAIARVDASRAETSAYAFTASRLAGEPLDALRSITRVVPTEALASCLGLPGPLDQVVADVEAVVRVIGRGEPASEDSDAAVDRLGRLCDDVQCDRVPVISLLYQNFDATAALIATTLAATAIGQRPAPAVPRTRRVALEDVNVAGHSVPAGTDVVLEIGGAGLPFGAGPHQCPGQVLAERIVAGVVAAIDESGYQVVTEHITTDDDGRPTYLPIRPVANATR